MGNSSLRRTKSDQTTVSSNITCRLNQQTRGIHQQLWLLSGFVWRCLKGKWHKCIQVSFVCCLSYWAVLKNIFHEHCVQPSLDLLCLMRWHNMTYTPCGQTHINYPITESANMWSGDYKSICIFFTNIMYMCHLLPQSSMRFWSIPIRWSLGADLRAQVKTSPAAGCGASRGGHHVPTAASARPSQLPEIKACGCEPPSTLRGLGASQGSLGHLQR